MARPKTRNDALAHRMLGDALALLEAEGPTALTARRVASEAESSTAAMFELFGNKTGLIRQLFLSGFAQLADALDALPTTDNARSDLEAVIEAARQFAIESPMLFEIMFARPFAEFEPSDDDQRTAARIYSAIVGRVATWLGTTRRARKTVDAAHAIVAMNRGLIASEIAGVLGRSTESVERRRRESIAALLDGIEKRTAAR